MKKLVIGIDVGGTNTKLGIINRSGNVVARTSLSTKSYMLNKNKLIDAIVDSIKGLILEYKVSCKDIIGIGVGLPGLIDPKKGIVKILTNIPGWKNVPLKNILQKRLNIPVFLENDVNLITLGEFRYGAGINQKNVICMTLGTGVGSGLILNGMLYEGEGYAAGELGHMPLNEKGPSCNCGGFGCFERYVGNKYLEKKARRYFKNNQLTLEDVGRLAGKGNKKAIRFWEETALHIGNALTGVVNLLNPNLIIIGGGVANSYRFISRVIRDTIRARAMKVPGAMVKISKAKLGSNAGLLGAKVLVDEMMRG